MIRANAAEERLKNIREQIEAYERGDVTMIACPYCGSDNTPLSNDGEFCCTPFKKASLAVLERIRLDQAREHVEQIMEKHSRN